MLRAVGWMYPSLTFLAVLVTVDVNQPKPLVSAATGSRCTSSRLGSPPWPARAGAGVLLKPPYRPPWLGGTSSGRAALSAPSRAKYLSSTSALPPPPPPHPPGLWLRLAAPLSGVPVRGGVSFGAARFLTPGSYS